MRLWQRIRSVILTPSHFFESIEHESGYRKQVIFLTSFAFFTFLFLTYYYLEEFNSLVLMLNEMLGTELEQLPLTIWTYAGIYLLLASVFILLSFLRYWITHWFVILFRGRHGYQQTYKAMVYTLAPEYISAPLFVAAAALFPLAYAKQSPWLWSAWILAVLMVLAVSVYQVYLRTAGLARLQAIRPLHAFLAIYVLGFLAQLLVVGMLELLLIALGYAAYLLLF